MDHYPVMVREVLEFFAPDCPATVKKSSPKADIPESEGNFATDRHRR